MMRRFPIVVTLCVTVVPLLCGSVTLAQDATPAPRERAGEIEGVTARSVASGSLEVLAPGTAFLGLGRITLEPGAAIPFDPTDPAAVLIYTASGALTFRVEAPMTIARRGESGTPVPSQPEAVEANTEFTLREGDSALFPPALAGEVRNDGTEPASAWLVNVALLAEGAATPTP